MIGKPTPSRFRGPDVLRVLKDHGQLSISTLGKMVEPKMQKKKLRRALERLLDKGLIERRKSGRTYYFISQGPAARAACSDLLGGHPDEFLQPLLKRSDWHHQELCEYWSFILKNVFPQTKIVRDREILSHELATQIMIADRDGYDLFPDLLLIFSAENLERTVSVAVEIERTRKSNKRLIRKLKAYATQTHIDGLLYICDSGRLADTIRMLYEKGLQAGYHRGRHYSEFYFLFSDAIETADEPLDRVFSASGRRVKLDDWLRPLLDTKWTLRRNEMFTEGVIVPPQFQAELSSLELRLHQSL
ncbi:MAG: hypothetical protein IPJ84_10300 [Bdellovibrionales bacterium]|nr:hypothetical protein [Bdellovibrionales bacterium]